MDAHLALTLVVRWLHVAAMAVALGGAVVVALVATDEALPRIAARYEAAFWAAAGVLVMTGVGNLAAFGSGLAPIASSWGTAFAAKLGFVSVVLLLSLPRSLVVARLDGTAPPAVRSRVRSLYVATVALIAIVVALAVVLAHG